MSQALLNAAVKQAPKATGLLRQAFKAAVPEALSGAVFSTGLDLVMGTPLDESLAYGAADAIGSVATLGLLNRAGIQNGLLRNAVNLGTGATLRPAVHRTLFSGRYPQQGQGGQAATVAQQQAQRGEVNNMTAEDLAGKYMDDTMFQAMQEAIQGSPQADLTQYANLMGPAFDPVAHARTARSIMGI